MNKEEQLQALRDGIRDCASLPVTQDAPAQTIFLPPSHRFAAEFDVVLVEGYCGSGKSYLAQLLHQKSPHLHLRHDRRENLSLRCAWGFAEGIALEQAPDRETLLSLLRYFESDATFSTLSIWRAVLVSALPIYSEIKKLPNWRERVAWAHANQSEFGHFWAEADDMLEHGKSMFLLLFDALDQLADSWPVCESLLDGILQLAQEVRGKHHIGCKIFLRPDMTAMAAENIRAARRLWPYKATLHWQRCDLYTLFFRRLANHPLSGEVFREICEQKSRRWEFSQERQRFFPPKKLAQDESIQANIFHLLTGKNMGEAAPYAPPYTWLINYLQDGNGFVSPQSLLLALATAAEVVQTDAKRALDWRALFVAVHQSRQRVYQEMFVSHPWVDLVMRPLAGKFRLPIQAQDIFDIWQQEQTLENLSRNMLLTTSAVKLAPRLEQPDPRGTISALAKLGVIQVLLNGDIQMNEVYRITFGFGRKGGMQPRS